ncbi:ankyrin repeat domain-containing protein 1-like [Daphnia carinata]|uniref:ankyrin repeat domain-containing protein 1-like n=1 Tax=Daphnia carinata TaxID=120202 RepID=UPI00257BB886|nr:ankyrin repeat domain-containing protein 1-like [Daphnia carinata]XP_057379554.1 ankyrin repeat domain-containing protein 1-like [Daphnia carinata]
MENNNITQDNAMDVTIIPQEEKEYELIYISDTESENSQQEYKEKESAKNADVNKQIVKNVEWDGIKTEKNDFSELERKRKDISESSDDDTEEVNAYSEMEPDLDSTYSTEFILENNSDNGFQYDPPHGTELENVSDTDLQCEPPKKRSRPNNQQRETETCKNCRMKTIAPLSTEQAEKIQLHRQATIDLEDGKLCLSMMEATLPTIRRCIQKRLESLGCWPRQKMAIFLNKRYEEGRTLLHTSIQKVRYDITDALLAYGANPEIMYRGSTIGHMAAENNDLFLVRILKHHNCEFTNRNKDGETPLMTAISHEHEECARLISTPTNIKIATSKGRTILHYLARYGLEDLATQICTKRIIDVNQQDETGTTALHEAVKYKRLDMIELLLLHGADKKIKDNRGHTAVANNNSTNIQ